jgi:leucyl-tRNA synthetase
MKNYDHQKIEPKWRKIWDKTKLNTTKDDFKKPKFFVLDMFPYPSGEGLHVGHPRGFIATDVYSRYKKMHGFNVLHPMGWDAFGLPAENYAIKNKTNPADQTAKNVKRYKEQTNIIGFNYDWNREVNTTDPKYYKWTQWIFLKLLEKGLAYESHAPINWCPSCKTGLANEDLEDGKCERCGSEIEKKPMRQWVLKITDYADRLLKDIDDLNWPESIKESQRNWIGRSEGAEFDFVIKNANKKITVFTTRADTLFGVTYVVLAPENKLVDELKSQIKNWSAVEKYRAEVKGKTEIERTAEGKTKTGVALNGVVAVNPANGEEVPVWIADYVLNDYGTGAVMAVPAHDERDFEFAKKYDLPIKQVIAPFFVDKDNPPVNGKKWEARKNVQAVVFHPTEDKIIQLCWKKVPWKTLVIGGVEGEETYEEAVRREVQEETGYKNFLTIEKLGWQMESHYFAKHKDVNRQAYPQVFVVKLKDLEKDNLSDTENETHEVTWVPSAEISKTFAPISELSEILANLDRGPHAFLGSGKIINSAKFNSLDSEKARTEITKSFGRVKVSYKLKDWVFSRQRYWGEPFPIVHCEKCGAVPVKEKDLPVVLPKVKFYEPTGTGESPLAAIEKWVNTKCPKCLAEKNKTKYLIFDFDGVLGDTYKNTVYAHSVMYGSSLKEAERKMMEYFSNIPNHTRSSIRTPEQIRKDLDFSEKFGKILADSEVKLFTKFIKEIKKYKNTKIAIVSSGSKQYVEPAVKRTGLKPTHILAFEDHHSKEEKIENVCKDWGVKVEDVYYFTDTKADVYELQNTLQADKLIGCAWGYSGFDDLKQVLAEKNILKDFKDIHRIFNSDCSAKRETNTMPQWAGSSWYYLRYMDPKNSKALVDPKNEKYWGPVDLYVGGTEHATRHLIYARFWHKFLFDIGVVSTKEPFMQLKNQGMILGSDNRKMSKRWGNVINPDEVVKNVGADTLRVYEMFMGPFEQEISWSTDNMVGSRRFLERVWKLQEKLIDEKSESKEVVTLLHKTIKKVTEDLLGFNFNTAISSFMIFVNSAEKNGISRGNYEILLKMLAPFAPHITEEIWAILGHKKSIHLDTWPEFDASKIVSDKTTIVVQINGKPRATFEIANGANQTEVEKIAKSLPEVSKWLAGKTITKIMFIKGKILSILTLS